MLSPLSILLVLSSVASSLAACYNRDGTLASSAYQACPGQTYCCKTTDTCTSNGLCQDTSNHLPKTDLVYYADGSSANFTNLYQTTTCTNADFSGCVPQCTTRALFQLPQAIVIPWNSTVSPATTFSSRLPQTTTTTSSASSVSSLPAASTLSTTISGTPTAFVSGPSSTSSIAADTASGVSQGTQIGIGIGVGVSQHSPYMFLYAHARAGVLILIIIGVLFWRVQALHNLLRKDKQLHGEVQQRASGFEPAPNYYAAVNNPAAEKPAAITGHAIAPVKVDGPLARVHELPGPQPGELP
ncbi:uncharacterized protein K489DRAFT_368874 [Dissoconium aciculare CBS 342.82]|uniref:Mid2 domain-containing protein n=1 Tax=Dissoconium aciculare CBS 342.82 TaxID=1314786 RepID=A0A6J3M7Q9_9PEZI|nr:uncharacterized protein K489DRAFT_368874 [Dissoconium aciculare CBS 342.82]KAF1823933.1 hypothetical protein K489DRAFT_368874 [Dissoconium aciculare CBS 342.82]